MPGNEPDIIPEDFIIKLELLFEKSEAIFERAHSNGKSTSSEAVEKQVKIFKDDSKKLRTLYSWSLMTWESDEPYLFQLGFAVKPKKKRLLARGPVEAIPAVSILGRVTSSLLNPGVFTSPVR